MTTADDPRYRAVKARDPRFDGRFFTAVRTTGVYCRPTCPARTPLPANVAFFPTAAAAEAAGFRACLRCRPEAAPGSPAWEGTLSTATRALRLIEQGALDRGSVEDLAALLGMGARHLRRLLVQHAGATPLALAHARRLHFARRLLRETALPIEEVSRASGFRSPRRFRQAFRDATGSAPARARRAPCAPEPSVLELDLAFRPPLAAGDLLAFLRARAIPGVEDVDMAGRAWSTTARLPSGSGIVRARIDEARRCVRLAVPAHLAPDLLDIASRVRRAFELDADPAAVGAHLARDPLLRPLVARRPGLRSPGAFDAFAAAVRVVVGQQVSVASATTLTGRIADAFGERLGAGRLLFPTADRLARAPLERCGLTRRRAETIRALAAATLQGALAPGRDLPAVVRDLQELPGVGPWTAHVVAMRALAEPDAFPASDLVLRRALGPGAEARAEGWRPFRAHAAMHLWIAAASGEAP